MMKETNLKPNICKAIVWTSLPLLLAVFMNSCKSNIPEDLDNLGKDISISRTKFEPFLGKTEYIQNLINVGKNSSLPLTFRLQNVRTFEGLPAPELQEKYAVKIWKNQYTGNETSVEDIEKKRTVEYHSFMEISEKNGNLTFWNTPNYPEIHTYPHQGYLFDIEYENSGGKQHFRNLKLQAKRARPYNPIDMDENSGILRNPFVYPGIKENISGHQEGADPVVEVYFLRNSAETSGAKTLTISVIDSIGKVIDIQKFSKTDFKNLVHGFNPKFVGGKVTYEVCYPIPLVSIPTQFTNTTGDQAKIELRYDRLGKDGKNIEASLGHQFAIYQEGNWEIQFWFRGQSPKFEND